MTATCIRCDRPDQAYACDHCTRPLHRQLIQVAAVADDVLTTITRTDRMPACGGNERATFIPEPPTTTAGGKPAQPNWLIEDRPTMAAGALRPTGLPVNLAASDRAHAAQNTITTWARLIIDERGLTVRERPTLTAGPGCVRPRCGHPSCHRIRASREAARRYGDLSQVSHAALLIAQHLDWLRHRPHIEQALPELEDACRDLVRVVDRPPDLELVGACDCGVRLYGKRGGTWITCRGCGQLHHAPSRWDAAWQQAQEQLVTAAEAVALMLHEKLITTRAQPRKRINQWAHRGQIAQHGTNDRGEAVYRYGDIADRMASQAA